MSNPPKRHRRSLIAAALVVLVAISVSATWVASGRIRSPAEAAARTASPEPSPILVPVERRVISNDIVTRGTGRFGSPRTVSLVPTELKATSGYVDDVPLPGTNLAEGDVALVHSGRPMIVLQGEQPVYRDLGPGMTGTDVRQLEAALERLGFAPGPIDGVYDNDTESAVSAWYAGLGYAPFLASATQLDAINALRADIETVERDAVSGQERVATARADLAAAQGALRTAEVAETAAEATVEATRREAATALTAAEAEAKTAATAAEQAWILLPPEWSDAEEQQAAFFELDTLRSRQAAAEAAVEQVRATGAAMVTAAENERLAAGADIATASAAIGAAQAQLDLALRTADLDAAPVSRLGAELNSAEQRAGVQVPADELVFVESLPVRVAGALVQRGSPAEGQLFEVTDAVVAIDGSLALDQVGLVEPGMAVEVSEPDLGIAAVGTVRFVADGPGTNGADGFHVYFETVVTDSSTPIANIVGASVRLRLPIESSGGPVLAVPASAVTLAIDGSSQLVVERTGSLGTSLETVTVELGLSASGYVEITSVAGGLAEGDLVVIGYEPAGSGASGG